MKATKKRDYSYQKLDIEIKNQQDEEALSIACSTSVLVKSEPKYEQKKQLREKKLILLSLLAAWIMVSSFLLIQSQMPLKNFNKDVTVIVDHKGNQFDLQMTLQSFKFYNDYKVKKIIVFSQQIDFKVKKQHQQVNWVQTNHKNLFDILTRLKAVYQIQTSNILYLQSGYIVKKKGLIRQALEILQAFRQQISYVALRTQKRYKISKNQNYTEGLGYSLQPHLIQKTKLIKLLDYHKTLNFKNINQINSRFADFLLKQNLKVFFTIEQYVQTLFQKQQELKKSKRQKKQLLPKEERVLQSQQHYQRIRMNYIAELEKFEIKLEKQNLPIVNGFNLSEYGIDRNIQVGTKFDYPSIRQRKQFNMLSQWQNSFPFEIISFKFDQKLQYTKKLNTSYFSTYSQAQNFISNAVGQYHQAKQFYQNLAQVLSRDSNNQTIDQAQYMLYDYKYKISQNQELPMCIFASGFNIRSKLRYDQFFQSIQRQNYSNYRLIVVDDKSTDNTTSFFYSYLHKTNFKLKNRIKIVYNIVRLGSVGNLYTRIKQFCKQGDIVVNVDSDDKLIGKQTLKLLNSVYKDPNIWVAYSKYIQKRKYFDQYFISIISKKIEIQSSKYRQKMDLWSSSHLKTFRMDVHSKIPIQYFIQYYQNSQKNVLQPHFFQGASDRFLIYPLIQLSGNSRVKFIEEALYYYQNALLDYADSIKSQYSYNCYNQHVYVDEYKARIKIPLKKLNTIKEKAIASSEQAEVSNDLMQRLKLYFQRDQECKKYYKNESRYN